MTEAIKGLEEIKQTLKKMGLSSRQMRNIHRSATRAGARSVQKTADKLLPADHQRNRKLDIQASRGRQYYFVFKIGPKDEHWALVFFEYGAKPHDIGPRTRKALRIPKTVGNISDVGPVADVTFTKKVHHPGITPTHFLSRAIDEGEDDALEAMRKQYWKRIQKLLR